MQYVYDESGSPIGINYRTNAYAANVFDVFYFEKNLQGDIVAVYNDSGTKIGTYTYDAWGNFTVSATSGITALEQSILYSYNPFRYRGYYYDTDIRMYYLQSRYYNPQWGRFLNADDSAVITATPMGLTDKNLYAYCDNNPIMRVDGDGEFWNVVAGAIIGATISLVSSVVAEVIEGDFDLKDLGQVAISTVIGAAEGALTAACPGAGVLISAAASVVDTAINGIIDGEDTREIIVNSATAGAFGAVAGTWGSDFVKGGKVINEGVNSIGDAFGKAIHPKVRKAAQESVDKAFNYIRKSYLSGQVEDFVMCGIDSFTSWYVNSTIESHFRR